MVSDDNMPVIISHLFAVAPLAIIFNFSFRGNHFSVTMKLSVQPFSLISDPISRLEIPNSLNNPVFKCPLLILSCLTKPITKVIIATFQDAFNHFEPVMLDTES